MTGVLVIDKPGGITSFDVVARVRRAFGERRVGHTGTLDPLATGVLPVCLGEATKLVPFLMGGEKTYEAEARLGVTTDTLDATGRVTGERDASAIGRDDLARLLPRFTGAILQEPPMHSALRVDGRRLYELAREGREVERAARPVTVHALELTDFSPGRFGLRVRCGKGTYIRSLVADLGAALGVGAHMTALRRTRVGPFAIGDAVALDTVSRATPLLDLAAALGDWPTLVLAEAEVSGVRAGKKAEVARLRSPVEEGDVRLVGPDGALVAVAGAAGGALTLRRVFC